MKQFHIQRIRNERSGFYPFQKNPAEILLVENKSDILPSDGNSQYQIFSTDKSDSLYQVSDLIAKTSLTLPIDLWLNRNSNINLHFSSVSFYSESLNCIMYRADSIVPLLDVFAIVLVSSIECQPRPGHVKTVSQVLSGAIRTNGASWKEWGNIFENIFWSMSLVCLE